LLSRFSRGFSRASSVSREIDSGALTTLNRVMGIAGTTFGAAQTELDDGNLTQVIDVNQIVRRSQAPIGSSGIFTAVIEHVHLASGALTATLQPYTALNVVPPFPTPIPQNLDFWIYGAALSMLSGTATFLDNAQLITTTTAGTLGLSVKNAGGPAAETDLEFIHGQWTSFDATGPNTAGITAQGHTYIPVNMRLRRGSGVRLRSTVSDVTTIFMTIYCGLFPEGLGQDVVT